MKFGRVACCAALVFAMLLVSAAAVIPAGAEEPDLRFGRGLSTDAVLPADALFGALWPSADALTDGERAYLRAQSGAELRYRADLPDSLIGTVYNGDEGTLTVTVSPYRYAAENGAAVAWIPESAMLTDAETGSPVGVERNFAESGDAYTVVFGDLWYSESFDITVSFGWSVAIPASVADRLLTAPRTAAEAALSAIVTYENAKSAYDAQKSAYDAYVVAKSAYDAQKSAYDAYVVAKAAYDAQKSAYDAYVAAKAEYDAKVEAYEQNRAKQEAYYEALTAYYAYEAQRKQNAELYERYEAYTSLLQGATERLAVPESMFLSDSHGWQFYGSLAGGTVDGVLARRTELQQLGVSLTLIDNAKAATDELRELTRGYAELRDATYETELEKTAALFSYYSENYPALRTQTGKLFENINAIYSHGMVQSTMEKYPETKARVPHFRQFLAQLYVLKCCLNDIETLDLSWTLPHNTTPLAELVEEPLLLTDLNRADPSGVTLPTEEVTLGEELPEPVPKPEKDFEELEDPRFLPEPEAVDPPPPEPAAVAAPAGAEPAPVEPPAAEPVAPSLTAAERALAAELRQGVLPVRAAVGQPQTLKLTRSVVARRSVRNLKTVTFYEADGSVLSVREVDYGSEITDPPTPTRPEDGAYFYTFLGWIPFGSGAETPIRLSGITSDLSLSPLYEKRARTYEVVWSVAGQTVAEYYEYGQTPVCPIDTARQSGDTVYRFVGWSPALSPVTAPAAYTAQYETDVALYAVTWDLGDRTVTDRLPYGATPVFDGTPARAADSNLYTFRGWDRPVSRVTGDAVYRAVWRTVPLVTGASGEVYRAEHDDGAITVLQTGDVADLSAAAEYARQAGKTLNLVRGELALSFSPEELGRLSAALCTQLEFRVEPAGTEEGSVFRVACRNSLGQSLKTDLAFSVTVRYPASDGLYAMAYLVGESGERTELPMSRYAGGRAAFSVRDGETVICRPEYLLQYTDESDNCNPTLLPAHAPLGETVSLATDCTYGYEVSGATLVYANGATEDVGATFAMPAERLHVYLHVTQIVYHVTFTADGKILSEQDLLFGEEVAMPPDPSKADDGEFRYLFTGWSPYVTRRATGEERNPVYTAVFSRTPLATDEIRVRTWSFFRTPLFLGAVAAVLIVVAAILLFIFRKKIFRKRKPAEPDETAGEKPNVSAPAEAESLAEPPPDFAEVPSPEAEGHGLGEEPEPTAENPAAEQPTEAEPAPQNAATEPPTVANPENPA